MRKNLSEKEPFTEKRSQDRHFLIALCIVIVAAVLVRFLLAAYPKRVVVYFDELRTYLPAQNLAAGRGFSVYFGKYDTIRVIQSFLLAPAFLAKNRTVRLALAALINTLLMVSGVIPVCLLGRRILASRKWTFLAAVIYLAMPDMVLNMTFMPDLCFLPFALWTVWFAYELLRWQELSVRGRIVNAGMFVLFSLVSFYTKKAAAIFIAAFLICVLFLSFADLFRAGGKKRFLWLVILGAVIVLGLVAVRYTSIGQTALKEVRSSLNMAGSNGKAFLNTFVYYIGQVLLAGGVFPILLPYFYVRDLKKTDRRFLLFLSIAMLMFCIGAVRITVKTDPGIIGRAQLRYVIFAWIPYFILFFAVIRARFEKKEHGAVPALLGGVLAVYVGGMIWFYHGPQMVSHVDYTLLIWAEHWADHRLWFCLLFAAAVFFFFFLFCRKKKAFFICFLVFWCGLQIFNNVAAAKRYHTTEAFDPELVAGLSQMIESHPDDTFLIVDAGTDRDNAAENINLASSVADTYLMNANVKRTSYAFLSSIGVSDRSIDLVSEPLRVYFPFMTVTPMYPAEGVDYLLIPREMKCFPDLSQCEQVKGDVENPFFAVYRLKDPDKLPRLSDAETLASLGNHIDLPDLAFYSAEAGPGGVPSFRATKADEYILFGPYLTAEAGSYRIRVSYTYEGKNTPADGALGYLDINGEGLDPDSHREEISASETSAEIRFDLAKDCENFEIRAHADVPGLQVTAVDIDFSPAR